MTRHLVGEMNAPQGVSAGPGRRWPLNWVAMLAQASAGVGVTSLYQPIVDLTDGTVVGYEALARFPQFPGIAPDEWFARARAMECAVALEAAALRSAFSARAQLPADTFLTVNLSPDVLFAQQIWEVLGEQGSLAGVVIELTEQTKIDSYVSLEPALNRLRGAGAMIAIDDAGSGYAGLQHLLQIRPNIIKLDRTLISGIDRDEAKRALLDMLGTLAGRLDAWVLAEGIESSAELRTLADLRVPLGQGYYLGRPAAPWLELEDSTARMLASADHSGPEDSIRSLVEVAVSARSSGEAVARFYEDGVDIVVIVDDRNRPLSTLDSSGVISSANDTLKVALDTPVTDAARRGIVRATPHRFQPMICIDGSGRLAGLVRYERIIERLTDRQRADTD